MPVPVRYRKGNEHMHPLPEQNCIHPFSSEHQKRAGRGSAISVKRNAKWHSLGPSPVARARSSWSDRKNAHHHHHQHHSRFRMRKAISGMDPRSSRKALRHVARRRWLCLDRWRWHHSYLYEDACRPPDDGLCTFMWTAATNGMTLSSISLPPLLDGAGLSSFGHFAESTTTNI